MFQLIAEKNDGSIFKTMTWDGPKDDGIKYIKHEAERKKVILNKVWSEELTK